MNSTYFTLSNPIIHSETTEHGFEKCYAKFQVPILPAYTILNYTIQGMRTNLDGVNTAIESTIVEDEVIVYGVNEMTMMLVPSGPTLMINYLGVCNYKRFFPHFENEDLKARAAEFLEEADKTFDEASWLSFVLMAGGVFESFIVDITGDTKSTFGQLIKKIENKSLFSDQELSALKDACQARNLVHAGKFEKPYITREKAMSVRLALEQLLRKDWFLAKNGKNIWS